MLAMTQDLGAQCRDYQRIETALQYLHAQREFTPSLAEAARQTGLSEYHFQRVFSRWAGISPKRYLQFLSKAHARSLLRASAPVLETALSSGLSGPGRLHDLLVSTEAATPGQVQSGGAGMELRWAIHATPFGACLIALSPRGICQLGFLDADAQDPEASLRSVWPGATLIHDPHSGLAEVACIFALETAHQPLHLVLRGTNFQLKVWEALLAIPAGHVTTYGQLAQLLERPGASRAVGSAVAANPIAYLIPCHRVIRSLGEYGQYRWGGVRKRLMLARESSQHQAIT